jgi:hypothetical protein
MTPTTILLGLVSSVIIEVLKIFPALAETKERKRITSFVISLVFGAGYVFVKGGVADPVLFITEVMAFTYLVYKVVVQTFAGPVEVTLAKFFTPKEEA